MRLLLVLAALFSALSVTSAGLVAQDKPNLSGKWVLDHDETPPEAKGPFAAKGTVPESSWKNGNLGPEFTLTHDVKTLKLKMEW